MQHIKDLFNSGGSQRSYALAIPTPMALLLFNCFYLTLYRYKTHSVYESIHSTHDRQNFPFISHRVPIDCLQNNTLLHSKQYGGKVTNVTWVSDDMLVTSSSQTKDIDVISVIAAV